MSLSLLNRSQVRAEFYNGLRLSPREGDVAALAFQTDSKSASERYGWADAAPAVEELTGNKKFKALGARTYDLVNKKYGAGVLLGAEDMARDQSGTVKMRMADLSSRIAEFKFNRIAYLLANGSTAAIAPAFDGAAMLASRTVGNSGAQTNLLTSTQVPALNVTTTTDVTPEEFATAVMNCIGYMRNYKDDEGEPMYEACREFAVIVPMQGLFGPAITALNANNLTSGKTNILQQVQSQGRFSLRFIETARLTTQTAFYIACTDAPGAKPFIVQEDTSLGSNPEFKYWDESSDYYKDNDAYKVFATWRGAVGVAQPLSVARCTVD